MIKHLIPNSSWITVTPQNTGAWVYNNGALSGQLRVNQSQELQVYDGGTWHNYSHSVNIGMHPDAESAIYWAINKMKEEQELKTKMEKYPMLKEAYEKFKTVEVLVSEA